MNSRRNKPPDCWSASRSRSWCGLALDPVRNKSAIGVEARISPNDARIQAWVVPVDEAALMAEAAAECLGRTESAESSPGK